MGYIGELTHPPRYGPEWGSGGIFGLRYHRGVLYYTLAFEAMAHFIRSDFTRRYRFELVGPLPVSGGDTYNAVDVVDDYIYFGGWVHAPVVYSGRVTGGRSTISFVNKYSHVHEYDIGNDNVRLLWKESIHHETNWTGEISEIIYDPVNDRLLLARADGMVNLGIYQIDRKGSGYSRISPIPALKGSIFYDHVCFDELRDWTRGISGIQCIDIVENRLKSIELGDVGKRSIDGGDISWPLTGVTAVSHGRFFLFTRGGVFVGNPIDESIEPVRFIRLFDFVKSGYCARRTMAKSIGGGILVAFNAYSETLLYPVNEFEYLVKSATNTIIGPSVLVYLTPPLVKIIAAMGARVTGIELIRDSILLATNNMANTGRYDASPIDTGYRGFITMKQDVLNTSTPPPVRFTTRGIQVEDKVFGGIPLAGYRDPRVIIRVDRSNELLIYEYDLSLPPREPGVDVVSLNIGKNVVDLKPYGNSIVAFKLSRFDGSASITIDLL